MKHVLLKKIYLLSSICCVSYAGIARAQDLPGSVDPGRLEDRFLEEDRLREEPEIIPPDEVYTESPIPFAPEGFILQSIRLTGVQAFDPAYFDETVRPYIGQKVDLNTLNHLAAQITQAYRQEGYFLSRAIIPAQEIIDGTATVQVVEGYVNNVMVEDPDHLLKGDLFNILEKTSLKIEKLAPLHGPTLERYLLLLNDSGLFIQSVLKTPENAKSGAVDIVLKVSDKPTQILGEYNNYGSKFLGPHQFIGIASDGNVINSFDRVTIQGNTALPLSEVQFGALSYEFPLNEEGLRASFAFSYSNSEPGYTLRAVELEGDSSNIDFGLSYPLIRSRRENLDLGVQYSILNSSTEFFDQELIDDKIRFLSIFGDYDVQDNWDGLNLMSFRVKKGLDMLSATKTGADNISRQQGRSDFVSIEASIGRKQNIFKSFQFQNTIATQYSPHPLFSSQEFGYGGMSFGRAYDPSEITGDKGVSTAAELRYLDIPTVETLTLNLVPFVFYDIGKVWNNDIDSKPVSAASAGIGTYYRLGENFGGAVQVAWPLTKSVDTPIMNGTNGPRLLFSVSTQF